MMWITLGAAALALFIWDRQSAHNHDDTHGDDQDQ
jgi:hypothetical protein